jgi:hypothetical protein
VDFHESVVSDPLFAAEGLDLESALAGVRALALAGRSFERAFAVYSWKFRLYFLLYPLSRSALPLPFLRALVVSERARRAYLVKPSYAARRRLVRSWLRAARAYHASALRYQALFERVLRYEPVLAKKTLNDMASNSFTVADLRETVDAFVQNGEALMVEARARARKEGSIRLDERAAPASEPIVPLSEADKLMEAYEEERLAERYEILERHRFGYRLRNFDEEETARQFVVFMGRNKLNGAPYLSILLADHWVFLRLIGGKGLGRLTPTIFKPIIDRGIEYFAQHLTWFYAMRDHQYTADLLTLADRARRPELAQSLVDAQRSSLLDLLLWRGADELRRFAQMTLLRAKEGDKGYSMGYAFFTYSNPSIYFMPFNHSVWRLAPISMIGSGRTKKEDRVYTPLEEFDPPLTPKQMRDSIQAGPIRRAAWKEMGILLED